jgi:hypothetical protein
VGNIGQLADIAITLDMPNIEEKTTLIGRSIQADIQCNAGILLPESWSHTTYSNTPPVLDFNIHIQLDYNSKMQGVETANARYHLETNDIAKQIQDQLIKDFKIWVDKHGLMPEVPEILEGKHDEPPIFSFLEEKGAELLYSGAGLMVNNRSSWSFNDQRPNIEVFTEVREKFKELGFGGSFELNSESEERCEYFDMSKGNEHINIFRMRLRGPEGQIIFGDSEELPKKTQIIVRYESLFSNEQIDNAMAELLEKEINPETLMIFEHMFRGENRERFHSILEKEHTLSMQGHLALARYFSDMENIDKTKEALMMAKAASRAEQEHNPYYNEIRRIAKKIEVENLAGDDIDEISLQKVGFINILDIKEDAEFIKELNEPVLFYMVNNDDIITYSAWINEIPSSLKSREDPYNLNEVNKTKYSSSHGSQEIFVNSDSTTRKIFNEYANDNNKSFEMNIKKIESDKFLFKIKQNL